MITLYGRFFNLEEYIALAERHSINHNYGDELEALLQAKGYLDDEIQALQIKLGRKSA